MRRTCSIGWGGVTAVFLMLAVGCAVEQVGQGGGTLGDLPAEEAGVTGGISDIPNPTPALAATSGKPLRSLQRGHEVFMLKCGECHYYMMPEKVDLMDWEDSMPEMIRHAGLGRAEERAVLDYVVAVRASHGITD